jgi:putative ABC transport system permease protein
MLKNYITIAIRNILKHRIFSFINIFGLAVAMTVCMAIMMLVADQLMNDRHNPNRDRIYRVNSIPYFEGKREMRGTETATTTLPVRDELLNNYTGIGKAVRLMRGFGNNWLELEPGYDINIPISGYFADPEVLEVFHHELLYGDPKTALVEPYSVVLTQKAAAKLFTIENPVGELLKVGEIGTYKVTGVIKETTNKSHIVSEAFASIATINSLAEAGIMGKKKDLDSWYNYTQGWVYILLEEGKRPEEIEAHLAKIHAAHFSELPTPETTGIVYRLQSLMKISPGPMINNPIGPFMPWVIIYFMSGLALVVLITSCFNFTNLSIARSLSRAREIGVRKVTGALRIQIFNQFISESIIIALFALVLSLVFLIVLKPFIVDLAFARALRWDLSANIPVYLVFVVFAVTVGVLAGLFPAGVLSGFQPVRVLKNLHNTRLMSKVGMRKALLVIQFTFSMIFILSVIVLYNQLNLFLNSDYGFNPENKILMQKGSGDAEILKTELVKESAVLHVSAVSHIPSAGVMYGNGFKKSLTDKEWTTLHYFSVDEDYLTSMEIPLVAGSFFSREAGESNKNFIVLNEEAVTAFHFDSPLEAIGQVVIYAADSTEKKIIGVVRNYTHEMAASQLRPMALMYTPEEFRFLQVSYSGSFNQTSQVLERVWSSVYPGTKVELKDFKKHMGELYEMLFGTLVKVLGFITVLAVIISCLGLLGMATYTIESRKKEIALRKVLGSTSGALIYTLSRGYISILLIAILLAVPAAYFINALWLENFAIHVSVDGLTITLGILILSCFGIITIGSQTVQAILVNPVDNLKSE